MQESEIHENEYLPQPNPCREIGDSTSKLPGFSSKKGVSVEDKKGSRVKMTLPKVLAYDEIDRLLLSFDDIEDLAACRIMRFAGLRVEEASSLMINDIDRERRALSHRGEYRRDTTHIRPRNSRMTSRYLGLNANDQAVVLSEYDSFIQSIDEGAVQTFSKNGKFSD